MGPDVLAGAGKRVGLPVAVVGLALPVDGRVVGRAGPVGGQVVGALGLGGAPVEVVALDLDVVVARGSVGDAPEDLVGRVRHALLPAHEGLVGHVRLHGRVGLGLRVVRVDVVEHHVRVDLDAARVHLRDHVVEFGAGAEARLGRALLVVVAEVVVVVEAVAHVVDAEVALRGRRHPDAGDARLAPGERLAGEGVPPGAVEGGGVHRDVPVEGLHHHVVLGVRAGREGEEPQARQEIRETSHRE